MALLLKDDIVYLHIPKTGGNWLTKILSDHDLVVASVSHKHATYDLIAGQVRQAKGGYFRRRVLPKGKLRYLAVVRHPMRWYESWFKYQTSKEFRRWGQPGQAANWHVMSPLNEITDDDFNTFLDKITTRAPGFVSGMYAAYCAASGAHILKNETIRDDLAAFNRAAGLGIPETAIFDSPAHGVSPRMTLTWDPALFDRVARLEAAALAAHGYTDPAAGITIG
ncbi:hypothetical protein SAMN05421759_101516 [Roseivivax lentus]|uniref:Sulfotransferase family protein n=1 Tax=Roseivivax lentus TaxID=633194 RepID=A0A1N7K7H8_9RHOB|nr:hypothetical protein [Roseivivax lentus]SIS57531.1 hypothetical protein SAMN05421759_101516 [Roseivivax lentus]